MSAEQAVNSGVIDRRDISLEELEALSKAVNGPPVTDDIDSGGASDPVTDFLETFATSAQLEAFEKAKEGSIVQKSKESTLWPRFRAGILWHPAIIGKLAALSGVGSLGDIGEEAWKDQGSCKEDLRFVSTGTHRRLQETRELMDVCEACPVRPDCEEHVKQKFLQYGFWSGVSRSKGTGYHDDGTPITLEEKRDMMDSKTAQVS